MDFSLFKTPLFYITLVSILIFFMVIINRFYPEILARLQIRRNIKLYLYNRDYHLIENIEINCADGKKINIKQLVVSRYGLFIIDTQHYRNTIYGSNHQVKWLSKGWIYSKIFINPEMEQQSKREYLAQHLHLLPNFCHNISVFTGNSYFPPPMPKNSCKVDNLIRTIAEYRDVKINSKLLPDINLILSTRRMNPNQLAPE